MSDVLTLAAADLQELIDILSVTTAPKSSDDPNYTSILVMTQRRAYGEVGQATLLVGMTSNVVTCGTYSVVTDGDLSQPYLISASTRSEISPILGSWMKEFGGDVPIRFTISSDHAKISVEGNSERALEFVVESAEMWPYDETLDYLTGKMCEDTVEDTEGNLLPAGKRVAYSAKALETLTKVSKKVKRDLSVIPTAHPASTLMVECGEWRGAVMAAEYPFDIDVDDLEVEFEDPRDDEVDEVEDTQE